MLRDKREPLSEKRKEENSLRRSAALTKDWTKGPILSNLLLLSWPMMMMETLYVVSQIVDMIWIGRLGSSAIAGVGVASIVLLLVMSMDFGLIVGVRALVARHVGADDIAGANYIAGQAFILSIIWGALITGAGILLAEPIIRMFGVESQVVKEGTAYLRIMFAGWVALEVLVMGLYVIQSSGDTMTPLKIEFSIRVLHVTLCPFLVKGLWVFPQLGVSGAALSNVISQILGAGLGLWLLFRGHTRLRLTLRDFRFNLDIIWRILKIGVPALVMTLQRSLGDLALTWFIVPFGTLAVAAHSLASRVDMLLFMPGTGLGSGAGVLVGQNLGAHQPERAERGAWLAVGFVEVFLVACSIVILLWAEKIMGIFTTEPSLIHLGSIFLRIATASYLVLALVLVLQSCIAGAGDTVPNMIISIGMIWAVQLPLAFLLPHITHLGVFGVRWAIVASTFAGTIAYVTYFRLGRWKTKKV
jgi:putative MATE family efflux protein